jgi:hypothetical protein
MKKPALGSEPEIGVPTVSLEIVEAKKRHGYQPEPIPPPASETTTGCCGSLFASSPASFCGHSDSSTPKKISSGSGWGPRKRISRLFLNNATN